MQDEQTRDTIPDELRALAPGSAQRRWLAALLTPEGLHHSEGQRGSWAGVHHRRIAEFVHRVRCAGWAVRRGRLARGTDRYWLDPSARDPERGRAYMLLGPTASDEYVGLVLSDAELRSRVALVTDVAAGEHDRIDAGGRIAIAQRLTARQITVLGALLPGSRLGVDELIEAARVLDEDG